MWSNNYFSVRAWSDWRGNTSGFGFVRLFSLEVDWLRPEYEVGVGLLGLHVAVTYYPRGKA